MRKQMWTNKGPIAHEVKDTSITTVISIVRKDDCFCKDFLEAGLFAVACRWMNLSKAEDIVLLCK